MGKDKKIIYIPRQLHQQAESLSGKQVMVIIDDRIFPERIAVA